LHALIVGALAVASANWPWPPLHKLAVLGSGGVLASFVVAAMLLRLPQGSKSHIASGITRVLNAGSPTPWSQDLEDHRLLEDRREDLAIPGDTAPAVLQIIVEDALEHLSVTVVG
jgi:hypothetical protein